MRKNEKNTLRTMIYSLSKSLLSLSDIDYKLHYLHLGGYNLVPKYRKECVLPTLDSVQAYWITKVACVCADWLPTCTDAQGDPSVQYQCLCLMITNLVTGYATLYNCGNPVNRVVHDDVIKWKHFPRFWPFVRGIHRSRWIPHTKASDAELWCFSSSTSE